jgi:hypothetical protein
MLGTRFVIFAVGLGLGPCGGSADTAGSGNASGLDTTPVGGGDQCGPVTESIADECRVASDCGTNNLGAPACTNCPAEALERSCSAGTCEATRLSGSIRAEYIVPPAADGALSGIEMVIWPYTADGRRLTCADLLRDCGPELRQLNVNNVNIDDFPEGLVRFQSFPALARSPAGSDLIFLMRLVAGERGEGRVLAEDCAEGIEVPLGGQTVIQLTFSAD